MKRVLLALILMLCGQVPCAEAEELSAADQFKQAVDVYYGGKTSADEYLGGYFDAVLRGAEGIWILLPPEFAREDVGATIDKACGKIGFRLVRVSDFAFTMTRNPGSPTPVTYTYVSMGGGAFSVQVDPVLLFGMLFPKGQAPSKHGPGILNRASGIATIYRPSPDILVVHQNFAVPTVYVRCP